MGSQAGGGILSTIGSMFGASSQKSSLNFQARMADINARIADGNARNLIAAGVVEESRIKLAGSQAKGSQIARMASSGIDIAGSPTAQARLAGTDLITEVDANTMRLNALRAAWGQRFEAGDQRARAGALRASASSISPMMAGLTTLMSTVGQVAGSWYTLNREGAFAKPPATMADPGPVMPTSGQGSPVLDTSFSRWPEAQFSTADFDSTFGKKTLRYGGGY
jgi:hypothetical protein